MFLRPFGYHLEQQPGNPFLFNLDPRLTRDETMNLAPPPPPAGEETGSHDWPSFRGYRSLKAGLLVVFPFIFEIPLDNLSLFVPSLTMEMEMETPAASAQARH